MFKTVRAHGTVVFSSICLTSASFEHGDTLKVMQFLFLSDGFIKSMSVPVSLSILSIFPINYRETDFISYKIILESTNLSQS